MNYELTIENKNTNTIYQPIIQDDIQWTTERIGSPAKLKFKVIKDSNLDFTEGGSVAFKVDGQNVFYGFVFSKKRNKDQIIEVTAYDQTRYLTNKDTYVYSNKTASDLIRMLASDFILKLGTIEDTSFIIPSRIEDNSSLLDIIYNALDLEHSNKGAMYVLYDDFGKLTLKSLESMKVDILLDEETGENFDYTTSIDDATYNKIKLSYDNEETGKRDIYIAQDGQHINDWGVLQYFDTLQKGENGEAKAGALLSLYNVKTRKLKLTKQQGDVRIRAGTMPVVSLNLGDMSLKNYMFVDKATHTFSESDHRMDLQMLGGGEFIG